MWTRILQFFVCQRVTSAPDNRRCLHEDVEENEACGIWEEHPKLNSLVLHISRNTKLRQSLILSADPPLLQLNAGDDCYSRDRVKSRRESLEVGSVQTISELLQSFSASSTSSVVFPTSSLDLSVLSGHPVAGPAAEKSVLRGNMHRCCYSLRQTLFFAFCSQYPDLKYNEKAF